MPADCYKASGKPLLLLSHRQVSLSIIPLQAQCRYRATEPFAPRTDQPPARGGRIVCLSCRTVIFGPSLRHKHKVNKLPQSFKDGFNLSHLLHHLNISSSPSGSYAPSLHSRITVPDSRALTVCHCPAGILIATTGPSGRSSIASVQRRSRSS